MANLLTPLPPLSSINQALLADRISLSTPFLPPAFYVRSKKYSEKKICKIQTGIVGILVIGFRLASCFLDVFM